MTATGAYFDYHPELQDAVSDRIPYTRGSLTNVIINQIVDVLTNEHPSTSMLPAQWHVRDEMLVQAMYIVRIPTSCNRYNFKSDPRAVGAVILLAANESSYIGAQETLSLKLMRLNVFSKTTELGNSTKERLIPLVPP